MASSMTLLTKRTIGASSTSSRPIFSSSSSSPPVTSRDSRSTSPSSVRSEERRVGKECRARWWGEDEKKKEDGAGRAAVHIGRTAVSLVGVTLVSHPREHLL